MNRLGQAGLLAAGVLAVGCDGAEPAPLDGRADRAVEAGVVDAARPAGRTPGGGALDAARQVDAGRPDGQPADASRDASPLDAELDAELDAKLPDAELPDAGLPDAELPDAGQPDAAPPGLCARQPDFDACVAVGCRWSADGECRFVEQAEPPCEALDAVLCAERLDCAPLGDLCQRTLAAPCVVLDADRCSLRPAACGWRAGRCVPAGGGDPCAAVPFPACPQTPGCHWVPEPCVGDCPELPLAQPWPSGACVDGDEGPCAALDAQACGADPACFYDPALPRCLTWDQRCGQADDLTCFEWGCFMVRYRLCDPVTRPDGSPDPDECIWREVFVCEEV